MAGKDSAGSGTLRYVAAQVSGYMSRYLLLRYGVLHLAFPRVQRRRGGKKDVTRQNLLNPDRGEGVGRDMQRKPGPSIPKRDGIDADDRFYLADIGLLVTARTGTGEDWRHARLRECGFSPLGASEHHNHDSELTARDRPSTRGLFFFFFFSFCTTTRRHDDGTNAPSSHLSALEGTSAGNCLGPATLACLFTTPPPPSRF